MKFTRQMFLIILGIVCGTLHAQIDVSDVNARLNEKLQHSSVEYRYKNLYGFYTEQTGVVVFGQGIDGLQYPTWDTIKEPKFAEVISSTFLAKDISAIKGIDKNLPFTLIIHYDTNTMIRLSTLSILDNSRSLNSLKKNESYYFLVNGIYNPERETIDRIKDLKLLMNQELLKSQQSIFKITQLELVPNVGCITLIQLSDVNDDLPVFLERLTNSIKPFLNTDESIIFNLFNENKSYNMLWVMENDKDAVQVYRMAKD